MGDRRARSIAPSARRPVRAPLVAVPPRARPLQHCGRAEHIDVGVATPDDLKADPQAPVGADRN